MFGNIVLTIIFIINAIVLLIVLFNTIIRIIKSKNYHNCKKLIPLELSILVSLMITTLLCIDVTDVNIIEMYFFIITYLIGIMLIPGIILILINILIILIIMKIKKYDSKNNVVSLRKNYKTLIILNIVTIIIGITTLYVTYAYKYYNRQTNAINYYENKYNISNKIIAQERIYEDDNSIGPSNVSGILYQLENGNKIYYDIETQKYYDNKQDKDIQKFIQKHYQELLDSIINELKEENSLSKYQEDSDAIELYSNTINTSYLDDYQYYNEEEFYFNNYYNLISDNEEEVIRQLLNSTEIDILTTDINIICDKNGNWENIIDKYIESFEDTNINFYLYDIDYQSKVYYHGDSFTSYINIDGKIEKRKNN